MKKVLLILVVLSGFCIIANAQANLPKGAKLKTIDYSQKDNYGNCHRSCYKIEGYVNKEGFVENQTITIILSTNPHLTIIPLITGMLSIKNGNSYIDGTYTFNDLFKGNGSIQGLFKVTNKINGLGLTVNKKDATIVPSIDVEDFTYYEIGKSRKYKSEYDFSDNEWEQIFSTIKTISELSDKANNLYSEKQLKRQEEKRQRERQEEERQRKLKEEEKAKEKEKQEAEILATIEEAESVLDNDYYSADCHPVEVLEKLLKQLEQLEKSISTNASELGSMSAATKNLEKKSYIVELQNGLLSAIKTQKMTKKYGVATAKKIMAGKYEIGMSKEIVGEIMGGKKLYYQESITTFAGKKSEIWEFDYNAEALRIFDLKVKNNLKAECPTFVFRDGKLTDILR